MRHIFHHPAFTTRKPQIPNSTHFFCDHSLCHLGLSAGLSQPPTSHILLNLQWKPANSMEGLFMCCKAAPTRDELESFLITRLHFSHKVITRLTIHVVQNLSSWSNSSDLNANPTEVRLCLCQRTPTAI